jgi:hypothetical protein
MEGHECQKTVADVGSGQRSLTKHSRASAVLKCKKKCKTRSILGSLMQKRNARRHDQEDNPKDRRCVVAGLQRGRST